MTSVDAARYRLGLAVRSLESARANLSRSAWRDSALFSRAAIEHGAKAILACFAVVPRSHEPAQILRLALGSAKFPEELGKRTEGLATIIVPYGIQEHLLLSYGDEEHHVDPWSLVTEDRARASESAAAEVVALAEECLTTRFG